MRRILVGCDGGGTKTLAKAIVLDSSGAVIASGTGRAGPGNVASSMNLAVHHITAAVRDALAGSGCEGQDDIHRLVCGLAGAGREDRRAEAERLLRDELRPRSIQIVPDVALVLAAAGYDREALALVCGTGAMAWARDARGRVFRAGGHGQDPGSGYWIGSQRRPQETNEATAEIAAGAEAVFAAVGSDRQAAQIVEAAAKHLACYLVDVARQARLTDRPIHWALAGGVVISQPEFVDKIVRAATDAGLRLHTPQRITQPVDGALQLARRE